MTKNLPTEATKLPAKFEYAPQFQVSAGSTKMTIALVRPNFIAHNSEYLVSPFPEMATSMGNDFEELLTSKGFTIRGPYNSRDEMVYNDKVNSNFALEVQIDLNPNYSVELTSHSKVRLLNILLVTPPFQDIYYSTKGTITFGGNLILTASSCQYGEKIWKKNIALEQITFTYEGSKLYLSAPSMANQLITDNSVYNTISRNLEIFYSNALELAWKQIDPEEMSIVSKQAKEADSKGN